MQPACCMPHTSDMPSHRYSEGEDIFFAWTRFAVQDVLHPYSNSARLHTTEVNQLLNLKEWIGRCKKQPKKPLRTERERKRWIKEHFPETKFVKHPTTQADAIAVERETLMLVGSKTSASHNKEEEYGDKTQLKAALGAAKEKLSVKTNSKDGWPRSVYDTPIFNMS